MVFDLILTYFYDFELPKFQISNIPEQDHAYLSRYNLYHKNKYFFSQIKI